MSKLLTPEKLAKQHARREKEILRWEKEKARPKKNLYFVYLILIIALIYATDEIASQIGTLMKTEIADDLLKNFGERSVSVMNVIGILAVPFQALGLLYRPLADRWGRKIFLIINTFGMSIAMLGIFLSNNLIFYFIGACLVQFFIPHDMHVVYIMESSPSKHRARVYSVVKFFANMAVMLVPFLRDRLMSHPAEWRNVYLIPAIVGIVTCFIALLFARESDTFIDSRLSYLKMTDAEREAERLKKSAETAQGGLIPALKFAMSHKQLKWLYITTAIANLGFVCTIDYQVILSYGFAGNLIDLGQFADYETAKAFVSSGVVTTALFMFPVGCAVSQVIMGFVSDSKGRKTAAMITAFDCLVSFILFSIGARYAWNPYLVGFFCGAFVGSYYSTNDVLIMMIGESAPTNLRSSIMSAQFVVTAIGVAVSFVVTQPLIAIFKNQSIGIVEFALLVPGFIAALIVLKLKTNETKGIDMDTVTGSEWD